MNKLYIEKIPFFLIFSLILAVCLSTCENPFIERALQPKKITFHSNGGSEVPNQVVYKGEKVNKPSDPQKGAIGFLGWFTDNNYFLLEWDFDTIPENDLSLYAKWTDFYAEIIPNVNIGIDIPVKGVAPCETADVSPESNFTAGEILWYPTNNPFLGGNEYTATVTLKADYHFIFAQADFTATVNEMFDAVILSNTGSTVTLSVTFPATLLKDVESITIVTQPSNMNYLHDDALDLSGLSVSLVYNDGTSDLNVTPANFGLKGIYTSVPNEAALNYSSAHNNQPITVTAGGMSTQTSASLVINQRPISFVSLTLMEPVVGQIPASVANGSGNYSIGTIAWDPWDPADILFLGNIAYTVSVTLTANVNYTFAGGLATATINGNAAGIVNNEATAVLSFTFPPTGSKTVTGIAITNQPLNLTYIHGQTLDLSDLSVTLTYNDTSTLLVPLSQFAANSITTSPAAGTPMSRLSHNDTPVSVIWNNSAAIRATTNTLVINRKTITITGVTAVTRAFNGTTTVSLTGGALQGVETFDSGNVGFTLGSGTMESADIGNNKQVTTNITLTGSAASNYTLTQLLPASVLVNITSAQITSAAVSITSPAANLMPSSIVFSEGHYTATVSWLRNGVSFTGTFQNGNDYMATVTLTAIANYAFSASLANVSINGNAASTSIVSNSGSTVVLSRVFQTEGKAVTSIATASQPSNLEYTHGEALNLTGLSIIFTYNDATTLTVPLAQFAANNVTTTPANNSTLSRSDHNNVPIIIIYNNSAIRASTNQLNITKAAGAAVASQNPSFVSGNSYTASPPVAPATGQSIEYAISTSTNAALGELTWQTSPNFTINAHSSATYYWYARTVENNDYLAGTHSRSTNGITFYSVSFNSDGQQFAPVQIVRSGQPATAPVSNPTKPGFGFHGWLNGAAAWNFASAVTSDITLTADLRANQIFSIGFDLITDLAPNIPTGLSFSRSGAAGQQTGITITLPAPPAGQTYTNIMWEHGGHTLGTGSSVTLNNDDIRVNLVGNNKVVSLTVFVNGVPYSKNVTFNVVN